MTSQMLARASFSAVCLTVFPFEFRPRTFTIGFYRRKIFHIRAYDFGVQLKFSKIVLKRFQTKKKTFEDRPSGFKISF